MVASGRYLEINAAGVKSMPEIKDCSQDIKINKETKDILTAASFGDHHTEIRQQAYDKIEALITEFNGHLFHGDQ